jgi:hypothetical protein
MKDKQAEAVYNFKELEEKMELLFDLYPSYREVLESYLR